MRGCVGHFPQRCTRLSRLAPRTARFLPLSTHGRKKEAQSDETASPRLHGDPVAESPQSLHGTHPQGHGCRPRPVEAPPPTQPRAHFFCSFSMKSRVMVLVGAQ